MSDEQLVCSRWWMDWFCWYSRRMVRRSFCIFAVHDTDLAFKPIAENAPLIVYANHPGWWDPIVAMLLCREYFPKRSYFAPIDADALRKYAVFRKLGYFGIQMKRASGAADFLRISSRVLAMPQSSLWITPEGQFTDPRHPEPPFMPGVAHLASKTPGVCCVPLAIEYAFAEEKLPLMLCRFGTPIHGDDYPGDDKLAWNARLTHALRYTQRQLETSVIDRNWSAFRILLRAQGPRHGKDLA